MDSQLVLKWHLRVLKSCGLWLPESGSILYTIWVIIFNAFVNIGFPISQLVCVLWVDSVNTAVHHLITTSSVVMAAVKGLNVLAKRKTFAELLRLMKELDATVTNDEYESIFKPKFLHSHRLLLLFCVNYIGAWMCLAIEVIMSKPIDRLWSSTYLYPSEFLHQRGIYIGGIIFQSISNLLVVFIDIVVDTYGSALLHVLGGHIEVLSEHLQALGKDCSETHEYPNQEIILINLCKKYILITRFVKLIFEFRNWNYWTVHSSRKIFETAGENPVVCVVLAVWR